MERSGREVGIREYRPEDEDAFVALRLLWDRVFDADALRALARGERGGVAHAAVADDGSGLVGSVLVTDPPPGAPDGHRATVLVHPDRRGEGLGTRLLESAVAALPSGSLLLGVVHDDDERSLAVVDRWGFERVTHGIASTWTARPVDAPVPPEGVHVRMLRSWDDVPEDFDAFLDASDTTPERDTGGAPLNAGELAEFFPEVLMVLAEVDGRTAAVAMAAEQGAGRWVVGYTGVHPSYRRRALGRLVKEHLHAGAVAEGAASLFTFNEVSNAPIRALNAALGYVPEGGQVRVRRRL